MMFARVGGIYLVEHDGVDRLGTLIHANDAMPGQIVKVVAIRDRTVTVETLDGIDLGYIGVESLRKIPFKYSYNKGNGFPSRLES